MTLADRLSDALPDAFFLSADQPKALQAWMQERGWLTPEQTIDGLEKAGDGNMNCVLRLHLADSGRRIIKQARPWVEKFPDIDAPAERADTEALYYRKTAASPAIAACSPAVLGFDADSHILLLEDLGDGADLSGLYAGEQTLDTATWHALADYLSALHRTFTRDRCDFLIENKAMRALNGEHIFHFPFRADSGFDPDTVTPGLGALARQCREDPALMAEIGALAERYASNGPTLLHGDFFPGSFLHSTAGVRVIDPEVCVCGDAEFDVGVLLAHLHLAQQPAAVTEGLLARYKAPAGFSMTRCRQYAGVEVLRRLLGLAQLPLQMDLPSKRTLVERARGLLLDGASAVSVTAG